MRHETAFSAAKPATWGRCIRPRAYVAVIAGDRVSGRSVRLRRRAYAPLFHEKPLGRTSRRSALDDRQRWTIGRPGEGRVHRSGRAAARVILDHTVQAKNAYAPAAFLEAPGR
ncbi:hypothetical protein GCM10023085_51460 [Actinomadura viridis]